MEESESRPKTLVFVRHGESEANVVQTREKLGDKSGYTEEYRNSSSLKMALTPRGIEQAQIAGSWIKENIDGGHFNEHYVSSFRRAIHTAGHLQLTEEAWKIRDYLREKEYGYFDSIPREERDKMFPEIASDRNRNKLYWSPLGGESMAALVFRVKTGIIATLHREVPDGNAIVVTHSNFMWAVRIVMEGLLYEEYEKLDNQNNPLEKMNNCQILQYTRIDPVDPNKINPRFSWMRTVCPWDTTLSRNEWQKITRPKYTNEELLKM